MNGTQDLISSDLDADMKNSWGTDPLIFNALNKEFNFSLDICSSVKNSLCEFFFTSDVSALDNCWSEYLRYLRYSGEKLSNNVWVNPPYGRGCIKKLMYECIEQKEKGITSVMLVPATLDAQWLPVESISEIRIITGGRLSFYHPITNKKVNGNTKGSMFVIFRPSKMPCSIRLVDRDELLELGAH